MGELNCCGMIDAQIAAIESGTALRMTDTSRGLISVAGSHRRLPNKRC